MGGPLGNCADRVGRHGARCSGRHKRQPRLARHQACRRCGSAVCYSLPSPTGLLTSLPASPCPAAANISFALGLASCAVYLLVDATAISKQLPTAADFQGNSSRTHSPAVTTAAGLLVSVCQLSHTPAELAHTLSTSVAGSTLFPSPNTPLLRCCCCCRRPLVGLDWWRAGGLLCCR